VKNDDLKISSRSRKQLECTIKRLREIYGEVTEHQGEEHDYLGIILTYQPDKKRIILNMKNYIKTTLDEFEQSGFVKQVNTPASNQQLLSYSNTICQNQTNKRATQEVQLRQS
jgi:hypothetical protein